MSTHPFDIDLLEAMAENPALDVFDRALAKGAYDEINRLRAAPSQAQNPCDKIFDHKWLDAECVDSGCRSLGLLRRAETAESALLAANARETGLRDAVSDMLAGWRYIRSTHGDLSGVGWNRAQAAVTSELSTHSPRAEALLAVVEAAKVVQLEWDNPGPPLGVAARVGSLYGLKEALTHLAALDGETI